MPEDADDTLPRQAMAAVDELIEWFSRLLISVFLMPALYTAAAREDDHLEV